MPSKDEHYSIHSDFKEKEIKKKPNTSLSEYWISFRPIHEPAVTLLPTESRESRLQRSLHFTDKKRGFHWSLHWIFHVQCDIFQYLPVAVHQKLGSSRQINPIAALPQITLSFWIVPVAYV